MWLLYNMRTVAKKEQDGHTMSSAELNQLRRVIWRKRRAIKREQWLEMTVEHGEARRAPRCEQSKADECGARY